MLLFALLTIFSFTNICLAQCPNCLYTCDVSSSCINSTCKTGFYGNGCNISLPVPNPVEYLFNKVNCSVTVTIPKTNGTSSKINVVDYVLYHGKGNIIETDLYRQNWTVINQEVTGDSSKVFITISNLSRETYTFGVAFKFNNIEFFGVFTSKISSLTISGCFNSSIIPTTTATATTSSKLVSSSTKSAVVNPGSSSTTVSGQFVLGSPEILSYTDIEVKVKFPVVSSRAFNIFYVAIVEGSLSRFKRQTNSDCRPMQSIPEIPSQAYYPYMGQSTNGNFEVVIGNDGSSVTGSNCTNPRLKPNTNYTVYAVVLNSNNSTYQLSSATFVTNVLSAGSIAAIVICLLLLLLLLVLLVLCLRQRFRNKGYLLPGFMKSKLLNDKKPKSFMYWSPITDRMEFRRVVFENMKEITISFNEEFEGLPKTLESSNVFAQINFDKNRDSRTITYDYSRVSLRRNSLMMDNTDTSYYNASFIFGYHDKKEFIAAESPMPHTIADFWWMIFQENVGQIVMFDDKENAFLKNKNYSNSELEVNLCKENKFAHFIIRKFMLKSLKDEYDGSMVVTQYHYIGEIKQGIPVNLVSFLEFYDVVKRSYKKLYGPTVVHCLTGCSISSIFIGFYILRDQHLKENVVNVFRTVSQMRRCRPKMVLTVNQYCYIYDLLFEAFLGGEYTVDHKTLQNTRETDEQQLDQFTKLLQYRLSYDPILPTNAPTSVFNSTRHQKNIHVGDRVENTELSIRNFWNIVFNNNINFIVELGAVRDVGCLAYVSNSLALERLGISVQFDSHNPTENSVGWTKAILWVNKKSMVDESRRVLLYSVTDLGSSEARGDLGFGLWRQQGHGLTTLTTELVGDMLHDDWSGCNLIMMPGPDSRQVGTLLAAVNALTALQTSGIVNVYYIVRQIITDHNCELLVNEEQYMMVLMVLNEWVSLNPVSDHTDNSVQKKAHILLRRSSVEQHNKLWDEFRSAKVAIG